MSFGMILRLLWALISASAGGVWLWRILKSAAASSPSRGADRMRAFVLLLCAFWSIVWLIIALLRLRYPLELEWIGGAMADHCRRAMQHLSLYVPPGPDWFPYEYPPFYFQLSAFMAHMTGSAPYQAMRLVSIGSTLGCTALVYAWTRRLISDEPLPRNTGPQALTASQIGNIWGAISAGLFLAAYRMTGAWYDVERLDMLFLFLSLLGGYLLGRGLRATALGALALALAFFTKQQAVLFILGGMAALAWRREWRPLLCFSGVSLVSCLLPALALNSATHGWFGYYCFRVPLANGIQQNLARGYLLKDLPLYAPVIAILLIYVLIYVARHARLHTRENKQEAQLSDTLLDLRGSIFIAMTVMGVLGSLLSRAHWGGDQNVLIAGYLFLGMAACVAAGRLERACPHASAPLSALLLAQLLALTYRPDAQLTTQAGLVTGQRFVAAVHELEQQGEVLCLDHGGITRTPHFQIMGLLDVLNTEKRMPPALTAALRAHRFVAVVTDALPGPDTLFYGELLRDYAPAERLQFGSSWVITGYPTPGPTRPVWVLKPSPQSLVHSPTLRASGK